MAMFIARVLLIFIFLPLLLVTASALLSVGGRFLLLFVLWPVGLMLFALWQYLRDRRAPLPGEEPETGERPEPAADRGRPA
jgi:hypothetical protein